MNRALCFFLIGLIYSVAAVDIAQQACQYIVNSNSAYSFLGFEETNVTYIDVTEDPHNITFDLCSTGVKGCTAGTTVTAVTDLGDTDCQNLANGDPTASFFTSNNADAGVIITYPPVTNGGFTYNFVVQAICNSSIDTNAIQWEPNVTVSGTAFTYTLTGYGAAGCPVFSLQSYLAFFEEYKYLFAAVFIIIGLFALLTGFRFFNVTIFIFTSVIVAVALFVVILTFTGLETSKGVQWGVFAACCIVGLLCGYAAIKLEKAGFFALGALLGGVGALFLYGLLLHLFDLSVVVLYVIIVVCALIGGGLSLWLWKDIIIIATSCIGSYLIIRGLSFYIGGFPNEIAVVQGVETYDYVDYVYLAFMVLVAIGGMIFQFRKKKRDEENEKEIHNSEIGLSESITRY